MREWAGRRMYSLCIGYMDGCVNAWCSRRRWRCSLQEHIHTSMLAARGAKSSRWRNPFMKGQNEFPEKRRSIQRRCIFDVCDFLHVCLPGGYVLCKWASIVRVREVWGITRRGVSLVTSIVCFCLLQSEKSQSPPIPRCNDDDDDEVRHRIILFRIAIWPRPE